MWLMAQPPRVSPRPERAQADHIVVVICEEEGIRQTREIAVMQNPMELRNIRTLEMSEDLGSIRREVSQSPIVPAEMEDMNMQKNGREFTTE